MQIISNNKRPTHYGIIKRLLNNSDEIIICVAFLKNSGLDFFLDLLPDNCTFYVGIDFYLTEPSALRNLIRRDHKVFFIKKKSSTFHPKMYYFRRRNKVTILIGSANFTRGGFVTNFELSVLLETHKNSFVDKNFKSIISYFNENSDEIISETELSQYERKFDIYKMKQKKATKEFNDEIKDIHSIDLTKIKKFVKEYLDDKAVLEKFDERTKNYRIAKQILNDLIKKRIISPSNFLSYYEEIPFHSSGLLRGKKTFARKFSIIIKIIKIVQRNVNSEPKFVFSKALPLVHSVNRFGINALTEIMNVYNPNKFSVANGRTLKSLSDLGFAEYPIANNFSGDTYDRYNNLIKEIAGVCQFKNLGQVDHFLSWYYELYVE